MWIITMFFSYLACINQGRRVQGKMRGTSNQEHVISVSAQADVLVSHSTNCVKLLWSNRREPKFGKTVATLLRVLSPPLVGWHVALRNRGLAKNHDPCCRAIRRLVVRMRTDSSRMTCSTFTPQLFLLDRDGVINRDVGAPGVVDIEDLELLPSSASAMCRLKQSGKHVVLVTNQSCRGKGLISADELEAIHIKLRDLLAKEGATFDELYVCEDAGPSPRKKPQPGMLLEAMMRFSSFPNSTVMIGDSWSDVVAARRAGCSAVLVATGHGERLGAALHNRGVTLPTTLQAYGKSSEGFNFQEFGVQNDAEALLAAEALRLPLRVFSDLAQAVDEILDQRAV